MQRWVFDEKNELLFIRRVDGIGGVVILFEDFLALCAVAATAKSFLNQCFECDACTHVDAIFGTVARSI